jgi:predicted aldo/keto reductase-like oxidoreductase
VQHRPLPAAPDRPLPILGLGGARLPVLAGDPARLDEPSALRLLEAAVEAGATWLDTSPAFHRGQAEPFLGRALRGGLRDRVLLAGRLPAWQVEGAGDWDRLLGERLAALGTDRLDACLLPALAGARWEQVKRLGGLEALARARRDGRIGLAGFTFEGPAGELDAVLAGFDWDLCQLSLDYLDRRGEVAGLLGAAAARGVGVVVAEPLRGGALADPPPVVQAAWAGSPRPWSPAGWALRWAWDQPGVVTVLAGTRSVAHLLENAAAAGDAAPLGAADRARLAAVREAWRTRRRVPCESCGGCAVCAREVPVADLLGLYNDGMFVSREEAAQEYREAFLARGRGADRCEACGVCEPMCPHAIAIAARLQEAHAWLTAG